MVKLFQKVSKKTGLGPGSPVFIGEQKADNISIKVMHYDEGTFEIKELEKVEECFPLQVIDTVETFRDMISGMLDVYLSSISNKMNEIMKVLTIRGGRDKMTKSAILLIAGVILITGCVPTKKYELSLNNANTLETEKADLEARLLDTVERLNKEKANRESLEREMTTLTTNRDDLIRHKESLLQINQELNETVAELLQEKLQTIKEKDHTINELIQEKEKAIAQLKGTYDNLVTELNEEIKKGEIEVTQLKDKLTLSMVDKILFDSGSTAIKQNGKDVLARVADILRNITDKQIRIEGHTDDVPIGSVLAERFPTNWELSTARSTTVVQYLQQQGIDPSFLSATGYSEFRPVDTNETEEGRAKNRRIEIVLIPLDAESSTNVQ